jgi:hypothetical protein
MHRLLQQVYAVLLSRRQHIYASADSAVMDRRLHIAALI